MHRPDAPSVTRIELAIDRLHELHDRHLEELREARRLVDEGVVRLAHEITDPDERRSAAQYLYWFVPEAKSATIAEALGGDSFGKLFHLGYFGSPPTDLACHRCSRALTLKSRTDLHRAIEAARALAEPGPSRAAAGLRWDLLCDPCRDAIQEARRRALIEQDGAEAEAKRERRRKAGAMSYGEYRRTEWWKERMRGYFEEREWLGVTGCDICRERDLPLAVHHRSLVNLGDEPSSDLCAACESCAGVLVRAGVFIPTPNPTVV